MRSLQAAQEGAASCGAAAEAVSPQSSQQAPPLRAGSVLVVATIAASPLVGARATTPLVSTLRLAPALPDSRCLGIDGSQLTPWVCAHFGTNPGDRAQERFPTVTGRAAVSQLSEQRLTSGWEPTMFDPTRQNRLPAQRPDSTGRAQDEMAARVYVGAGDTSDRAMPAKRQERQRLIAARGTRA